MMDLFRRMGKKVIYVTNNAIYPTETNVAKLTRLGYKAEKVRECCLRIQELSDVMIHLQVVDNHSLISYKWNHYHILEICVRRAIFCTVPPYFYAYLLLLKTYILVLSL